MLSKITLEFISERIYSSVERSNTRKLNGAQVIGIILVLVVFGMAMYVLLPQGLKIHINDGTIPLKSNEIPLSTVPTLINGIVTSTSIVIAFGGTIAGIHLSRLPKNDKRRIRLLGLLAGFAFSFVYTFIAYE